MCWATILAGCCLRRVLWGTVQAGLCIREAACRLLGISQASAQSAHMVLARSVQQLETSFCHERQSS